VHRRWQAGRSADEREQYDRVRLEQRRLDGRDHDERDYQWLLELNGRDLQ
jgi:hypothetical protein